ncbi:MAG: BLUF domain-containing protein [Cellvibrionaceae bacterium]
MISLCYVSSSTKPPSDNELVDLLKACHQSNSKLDITGLLLYNGIGTYLQALEGDEISVRELYDKIKKDPRHERVHKIGEKQIENRSFPEWKMGFRNTSKLPTDTLTGFSQFMNKEDAANYLSENTSFAYEMLSHFRNKSNELLF